MVVHGLEHVPPRRESRVVDSARQVEVLHAEAAVGRVAAEAEGGEGRAQVAGARVDIRLARNAHIRRQIVSGTVLVRDHASEARVNESGTGSISREHVVRAALVRRLAVRHRADDRQLVGNLSGLGERLAELLPVDLRGDRGDLTAVLDRRVRLRVERLLVGDAAWQEDMDDRVGPGLDGFVALLIAASAEPEVVAQGQPEPHRSDCEEVASIDHRAQLTVRHGVSPDTGKRKAVRRGIAATSRQVVGRASAPMGGRGDRLNRYLASGTSRWAIHLGGRESPSKSPDRLAVPEIPGRGLLPRRSEGSGAPGGWDRFVEQSCNAALLLRLSRSHRWRFLSRNDFFMRDTMVSCMHPMFYHRESLCQE